MDSDGSLGAQTSKQSTSDSVRNLVATLLSYLELRLRLLGLESKEAGFHLLTLGLLFAGTVVFFAGFLIMLIVFLLYLVMLIFHWEWGWSALVCGGVLLLISIVAGVVLRFQIIKPLFPITFAEFEKDREWLTRKRKKSE